jgi:L-arabinose isomerase
MLDIDSDRTQQYAYFVGHIEILEVEKLAASRRKAGEARRRSRHKPNKAAGGVRINGDWS